MNTYLKMMKDNKKYNKMTRSLISYLIKFARLSHYVQKYIKENSKKLYWIIEWIGLSIQNASY